MNERIKELEAQCWEPRKWNPPWFNYEKFAELIVRECILAVSDDGIKSDWYQHLIKQHFGVEE